MQVGVANPLSKYLRSVTLKGDLRMQILEDSYNVFKGGRRVADWLF